MTLWGYGTGKSALERHILRAKQLEASGFWRRAARQWLAVIDVCCDVDDRLVFSQRRAACLRRARAVNDDPAVE